MRYVALLRAINVGGKSKVDMPTLRAVFERVGCDDVRTYINSGNVIFRDQRSAEQLTPIVEDAIEAQFGFAVPALIRDLDTIARLCAEIPDGWTNDSEQRTDVVFLRDEVDTPDLLDRIKFNPEIENVRHVHGALVWNISRRNATRSNLTKLVGTPLYKSISIRNVNTARKLLELMTAIEAR
jgi:uncharacterized protein (DUF1697 family)